ncbi:ABC transporter permease/M1 family aminopeptidase [Archangium sp.]|uniref:ABC transporter permease/M1 family aminopeptidase n=1 Tax=Archangium sp. TaxID=1872627 RepID=UPI002D4C8B1F|nr:M1 family aminopeptidase [Archangium sp.]HYO53350.1 M1 family aminopeptidase [Archangium sp.]
MLSIALFELRQRLKMLSTWVYFGVFFVLACLAMNAAGGAFKTVMFSAGGGGKVLANSPFTLTMILTLLGFSGVIVTGGVMGQAVYQDFAHGTHALFFTAPISRARYLLGRFLGAFLTLVVIFSSIGLGARFGATMPFLDQSLVGPTVPGSYLRPYLVSILPNLFFTGALFFGMAALTRRILPVYVTSVVLLVGYLVGVSLLRELDTKWVAALVDPFGMNALRTVTEYWTAAEKNTRLMPLEGWFFANRLLWTGLGAAMLGYTLVRFQRTHALAGGRAEATAEPASTQAPLTSLSVTRDFRAATFLRLLPRLAWLDLKETVKNVYFLVMVLAGVIMVFGTSRVLGTMYGTSVYPVTYLVVELVGGGFSLFHIIIITFYSGELIWRERDARMHQLHDALPMPGWLPFLSKLLALMGVQVLLNAVLLVCGVLVQLFRGYTHLELGLYLTDLFGYRLVDLWQLCMLAVLVHVVVNHKYVGHFVMVLYLLASQFAPEFGFEHNLYSYAGAPTHTYSDMNGFGPFVAQMVWFRAYWALVAVALAFAAHLLWVRGTESDARWRLRLAGARASLPVRVGLALSVVGAMAAGAFIFHNTNRLNPFKTEHEEQAESADYEKRYKPLARVAQPRIVSVKVQVDLFPEEPRMRARGTFGLVNKTAEPVKTVYVNLPSELKVYRLAVAGAESPSEKDTRLGFFTYTLPTPLAPGASAELQFELGLEPRGFRNKGAETALVENGTFLHSTLLPRLGYVEDYELEDDEARKKQGLAPRERMADVNDLEARRNTYIASDSDWVTFEATVGTSPDQVAVAPGYLQREWTENGRRYFHYTMDSPILNFYSFLSARYEVKRDRWNDVAIEVFHHSGHAYNVERMIQAVKDSLDYYTKNFGPYQHRQVRILEFPRYATFAQSFPNTIPYSESIGFIAQVDPDDPDDVDYPYYVTAHEVAHQWWAHQVIGGNVQGSTLMSETLSQYSALMVMKKKYGEERMGRFLRYEMDGYLRGRAFERKREMPLMRVENQPYVHYNKGSVVMYALQDYVGEDTLNRALASYRQKVAFQQPPFTNSPELLAELRAVTPEHLRYLIQDFFERITLYENRALEATYTEVAGGKFEVKVTARARKVEANGTGTELDQELADWMDVGVLDEDGKPLYLEKVLVTKGDVEFTALVDKRPAKAGVDPLNKLIDRKPDDNTVAVEKR